MLRAAPAATARAAMIDPAAQIIAVAVAPPSPKGFVPISISVTITKALTFPYQLVRASGGRV